MKIPQKILARQHEITQEYLGLIDEHLEDLLAAKVEDMFEIRDFAEKMHIHPTHLSNTIKLTTGYAPCYFFENKIMEVAKGQLLENKLSVAAIARQLTYDPSNFSKFFKHFEGITPKQYREAVLAEKYHSKEGVNTI